MKRKFRMLTLWSVGAAVAIVTLAVGEARPGFDLIIPRPCMVAIALTADAECRGRDRRRLSCTGLLLTIKPGCEELRVAK